MPVSDIVVYGAGGTSQDLIECLEAVNQDRRQWNILGLVDDNPALAGSTLLDYPVLGPPAILGEVKFRQCRVVIGVANDRDLFVRRRIRQALDAMPAMGVERLPVIVHPSAVVSRRSRIGAGTVFFSGSFCSGSCTIGMHTLVLQGAVISHDSKLGDYVTLCADVAMGGGVEVEDGAFVGLGSAVYPRVRIGKASRIGLGSVVLRDVAPGETVSGSPARIHARRSADLEALTGATRNMEAEV